jgi:heme/copper-type cytochrome/quinol oxidase subunit 2
VPVPPPGPIPVTATRWRSIRALTTALTVFLALGAVDALFGAIGYALRIHAVGEIITHGVSFDRVQHGNDANDLVQVATGIMAFITFVLLVLVIVWTYRASKNNDALGRPYPRLTSGWAIAGWLIPFANAVLPVLILQDLWRGSQASTARGDASWRRNRGSVLVGWYWALFLLSLIRSGIGRGSAHVAVRSELHELRGHDAVAVIGMLLTIAAAVLAIQVFRRIAARQQECLAAQQAAWVGRPV